jgi:protein O-mannosyl-transferase
MVLRPEPTKVWLRSRHAVPKTRTKPPNVRRQPPLLNDSPKTAPGRLTDVVIYLTLLLATFTVYAQVLHFDFVNLDDSAYTSDAPHVRHGITAEGLKWAFTSGNAANWFPVTWISHMLDCQFFGLESGWHHLINVLIHGLAAMLLFAFLRRATSARWRSALVAFLFAVHPLHVESVAWIAERKDVLSAFFWFLTLWFYVRYTERPGPSRYAMLLLAFCLGLMSKSMVVTLPFVLLLLDVWPLGRWPLRRRAIFWEKAPLFALSLAVSVVTLLVQQQAGAVKALSTFPFRLRLENALLSYCVYIFQMFWPLHLAVFYPYPQHLPSWQAVLAGLVLAGASAIVVRVHRSYPYLATGWFWYIGTLIPVIGLVQVGSQAHADRYTYIPMVGLSIMVAWGLAELARRPRVTPYVTVVCTLACLACASLAWFQIQYWRNSETLFRHALDVTENNAVAHTNLGIYLMSVPGESQNAIGHLDEALRIDPDSIPAQTELGHALAGIPGRLPESFPHFQTALRLAPDWPVAHNELGSALLKAGQLPEAVAQFAAASRLDPDFADAHYNLALALSQSPGRMAEAVPEYHEALRIEPDFAEAQLNLGNVLTLLPGRFPEAIQAYEAALRIRPGYAEAHYNLGRVLSGLPGRLPEAIAEYQAALRIRRDYAEGHYALGVVLAGIPGRLPEALEHLEIAQRLKPNPDLRRAIDRLRMTNNVR